MQLGLCLAGGGIKGAAHIGCIKAFEEAGISFDYISGTSSGSIVACLYALGYSADDMLDIFKKYCKKIKYIDFSTITKLITGVALQSKFSIMGLNSGSIINKLISKVAKEKDINNIRDIKRPLIIPSIDLESGSILVFTSIQCRKTFSDNYIFVNNVPLGTCVQASCSFPRCVCSCALWKFSFS